MSPTSRDGRPGSRRFMAVSVAVVAVLALASTLMAAAALVRGPQVRAVTGDTASAVAQRGVTLTLRTDQPLDAASAQGVALDPAAPLQVEVVGASLRVRLTETLDFATDYRLVVPGLRGQTTGTVSATEYDFTTPPLTVTTLERGGAFDRSDGDDAVVRHDLSHHVDTTILRAPRIQEYAAAGGDTVALTLDRDGAASLQLARATARPPPSRCPGAARRGCCAPRATPAAWATSSPARRPTARSSSAARCSWPTPRPPTPRRGRSPGSTARRCAPTPGSSSRAARTWWRRPPTAV